MNIRQNVSLRDYSTMRLGGSAAYLVDISTKDELLETLAWAEAQNLPVMMIGGGSNIVWKDEGFPGLIMVNKMAGFDIQQSSSNYMVTIAAGEEWDSAVRRTVDQDLHGIEALSLIPGTAGATPVQNVGAYGQEISQTLVQVDAYDRDAKKFVSIYNSDCQFGYRTSRFKTTDRGRYFITGITLRLIKSVPMPPFYQSLEKYFAEHNITRFTPQIVRDAVIAIRNQKLPDPKVVANNGSFFANPVVSREAFYKLKEQYGEVPNWPTQDGQVKIPAAWLLDQTGFKDKHDKETGMATWAPQPLVLVNEHAEHTAQLLQFKQKIIDAVQQKFSITLEQEPELLP